MRASVKWTGTGLSEQMNDIQESSMMPERNNDIMRTQHKAHAHSNSPPPDFTCPSLLSLHDTLPHSSLTHPEQCHTCCQFVQVRPLHQQLLHLPLKVVRGIRTYMCI